MYDKLFTEEHPGGKDFKEAINPESLKTITAKVEPAVGELAPGERFQFERTGYFCRDEDQGLVINRTVPLRDSWAKIRRGQEDSSNLERNALKMQKKK